jgi:HNH endonuclease
MLDNCVEWTGPIRKDGYGYLNRSGKRQYAHRVAWQERYGLIPNGLFVCHTCDNRKCVNPGHLFLGTIQDNTADMVKKNRQVKGEQQHLAKLNKEKVKDIRKLNGVLSQRKVAALYGVDQNAIWLIWKGRTWKDV